MKFVRLKLKYYKFYSYYEGNDEDLWLLAEALYNMIDDFFYRWLNGEYLQDSASINAHILRKHNGRIYVGYDFESEEEQLKSFNTTEQHMREILEQWRVAYLMGCRSQQEPYDILFIQEGDKVTIITIDPNAQFDPTYVQEYIAKYEENKKIFLSTTLK